MQRQPKTSLLVYLALITAIMVIGVFALNGMLQYSLAREAIIEEMNLETEDALQRLSVNVTPYVAAYAVNDYQRLLAAEIENRHYLAILVDDKRMAEMTSQTAFTTGNIRNPQGIVETYDAEDQRQQQLLNGAFNVKSRVLYSTYGDPIGTLTIYNTDRFVSQKLHNALYSTLLLSILSAGLLILLLLGIIRRVLVKPLNLLANRLTEQDEAGIPRQQLPDFPYHETSLLSQSINNMLTVISDSRTHLQREKLVLENVLQATRVGIWEWNVQTGETRFNERWAEIIGYRLKELEPVSIETWMKFAHPDDLETSGRALEKHFSGEAPFYEVETRMRHKAGHWVWVVDRGKVSKWTPDGKPLWMTGTHQDITRRKQASQELADSLARYQHLSESSPAGVWQVDAEGRLAYVSPRWIEISGFNRSKIGTHWTDVVHPDDLNQVEETWRWVRQQGQMLQTEFRFAKPDGQTVWVLCLANPETRVDGEITGWIGTVTDITSLKNTAEKLRQASQQAESANIAKSRFLATMSHEIRTPMNGILGMAQLLLDDGLQTGQRNDYVRTILNSGQSLLALLNDILDLSKVEAGKMALEEGIADPGQILDECHRLFNESAQSKGLTLTLDKQNLPHDSFTGDPYRLNQMLRNLINNAIKFTDHGEVQVGCQEISRDDDGVLLEFSVTDTGIGISQEKQQQIFTPFTQADDSTTRVFGGTGLGLSIVASLAELMQGSVGVESEEGVGSRFWFRVRLSSRTTCSAQAKRPDTLEHFSMLHGHILIAEDVQVNYEIASAMLQRFGLHTSYAGNGQDALQQYTESPDAFQLVLMDLHMPELNGIEATQAIRQWETEHAHSPVPIIAMTADAFPENKADCYAAGMNDYVSKPIMADNLHQVLAKWLDVKTQEKQEPEADRPQSSSLSELIGLTESTLEQLETGAFNAIDSFSLLQKHLSDRIEPQAVNEIGLLIDAFRFEEAAPKLRALRASLLTEMGDQ